MEYLNHCISLVVWDSAVQENASKMVEYALMILNDHKLL